MAQPLGAEQFESVKEGNIICVRTLVIMMVAAALHCWTILEQPKGSLMEMHPAFQEYLSLVECWRASINMSTYGGPTLKPTWLYSNRPMIDQLHVYRPPRLGDTNNEVEMVVHYTDSSGRARVKGGKHLKQSQSYPRGFLVFGMYYNDVLFVSILGYILFDLNHSFLAFSQPSRPALRFGKALARLRSRYAAPLKREAKKEIRDALVTYRNIARNTRANARWIKWANLQPVLDHLM